MSRANYRRGITTNAETSRRASARAKVDQMDRMQAASDAAALARPKDTRNENRFIKALGEVASNRAGGSTAVGRVDDTRSSKSRGIENIGSGAADIIKTYKSKQ